MVFSTFKNLLPCLLLFLSSCESQNNKATFQLMTLLQNNKVADTSLLQKVIVLSSNDCFNCNISLSLALESNFNKKTSEIIVTADESKIDISRFKNRANVIFIKEEDYNSFSILKKSQILFLKNNLIDSIVVLNPENLEKTLRDLQ